MAANRDSGGSPPGRGPTVDTINAGMASACTITAIGTDIKRTDNLFRGLLGMRRLVTDNFDDPGSAHWYWGWGGDAAGRFFERDPRRGTRRDGHRSDAPFRALRSR